MTAACTYIDLGLLNQLQQYSFGQNQRPLCIYGDPVYPLRVHLQVGFKGARLSQQQVDWNTRMSEVRVSVEWIFGDIITYFKFLEFKKKSSSWENVYCMCLVTQCKSLFTWKHNIYLF